MICLENVKKYCKEYWKIENYQEAMADTTQIWHCHHRHEIEYNLSKIELQALGFYFNRPFDELIFLTQKEHKRLHNEGENHPMYGKQHTEETKQKMSTARKERVGENAPYYGKQHTEETKQKIGAAMKERVGENAPNYKYHISAEELYDLYIVQGLTLQKIAELYGCKYGCVWLKLKKYNIIKNK